MKKSLAVLIAIIAVLALSHADGATSRLKVKTSPLGKHSRSSEHHVGKVRSASCAGVSRSFGAVRFGAVRAGACSCGCGQVGCTCGK